LQASLRPKSTGVRNGAHRQITRSLTARPAGVSALMPGVSALMPDVSALAVRRQRGAAV
jgi:hypothetical protein